MGYSTESKKNTHERIVKVASEQFRKAGIEGIGIADVMEKAGVTVGGFYKHFESRDQLVLEALLAAIQDFNVFTADPKGLPKAINAYLSPSHRDIPERGCAIAAFAGEMSHCPDEVRSVFTQQLRRTISLIADAYGSLSTPAHRRQALLTACALVGAINLSRAVNDVQLSDEILHSVRRELRVLSNESWNQDLSR